MGLKVPTNCKGTNTNGRVMYNVNSWKKIISLTSKDKTNLSSYEIHSIFYKFHIQQYEMKHKPEVKLYAFDEVENIFLTNKNFRNIILSNVTPRKNNKSNINDKDNTESSESKSLRDRLEWEDGGPYMDRCSDYLIRQDNFESKVYRKSITINEKQLNKLLKIIK